ncbi:MAG TPA: hypothetical protein VIM73_12235, partial [Polyangiaceae bacterium]
MRFENQERNLLSRAVFPQGGGIAVGPETLSERSAKFRTFLASSRRARSLLAICVPVVVGCSAADGEVAAAGEEQVGVTREAISLSQLNGYWERHPSSNGPIVFVDFTDLAAPAGPPAGSRTFVMRSMAAPDEFVGAYTMPNASTVRVSLWGQNPGPPSHSGDWNVTSGAPGCSSCIVLRRGTLPPTTLTKITGGLGLGGSQQPVVIVTPSVTPGAATEVVDYAASELHRHLSMVLPVAPYVYSEAAIASSPSAHNNHRRFYLGNTVYAQKLGLARLATAPESWVDRTVGRSVVLYGPESGAAARSSSFVWSSGGLRMTPETRPFHFEIPPGENLVSAAGGTIEFWIRDDEVSCTNDNLDACYRTSNFMLRSREKIPARFGLLLQHFPHGVGLTAHIPAPSNGTPDPAGTTTSSWPIIPVVPRDGQMHHVTISFAPCGNSICGTTWIDGGSAWTTTFANSSLASLDLTAPWHQLLEMDAVESRARVTLFGFRIADRPTTAAEHYARTLDSIRYIGDGDTFLMNLTEGSGQPFNKRNAAFLMVPPTPSIWGQRGTLHATYEWLQRVLGVRWYMPGRLGIGHDDLSAVAVPRTHYVLSRPLRHRFMQPVRHLTPPFHVSMDSLGEHFEPSASNQYALRVGMGGEDIPVVHSFYSLQAHENTPAEWFSSSIIQQPCFGHPGFVNRVSTAAKAYAASSSDADYLQQNAALAMPEARNNYFALGPHDGDVIPLPFAPSDCNYANAVSRGLLDPNYPASDFFSGEARNYLFDFYNRIARDVQGTPGRPVTISALAYMDHSFPPDGPIESNLLPTVTFAIRNWSSPAGAVSRSIVSAWAQKDTPAGFMGWTYLFDSIFGEYQLPAFEFRNLGTATQEIVANRTTQFSGLMFEHSTSWDGYSAAAALQDPEWAQLVADFRAFRDVNTGEAYLWDRWPLSLSLTGWLGTVNFFQCKSDVPTESHVPQYTPYCARYNNAIPANEALLSKMYYKWLRSVTEARGAPSAQLDLHLVLRAMSAPARVGASPTPPALDIEAEVTRYFATYYRGAASTMRSVYQRLESLVPERDVSCPGSFGYGSRGWAQCMWTARIPRTVMHQVHADMELARAAIGATPRFTAFRRNVWCTLVRGYYEYHAEATADRLSDVFQVRNVCAEDA